MAGLGGTVPERCGFCISAILSGAGKGSGRAGAELSAAQRRGWGGKAAEWLGEGMASIT